MPSSRKIFKKERHMKKILLAALLTVGVSTAASAHHLSSNDDAGAMIPDWSPHLLMVF